MIQEFGPIDIDGRTFWVRPVGSWVLDSGNVVAEALAVFLALFDIDGRTFLVRPSISISIGPNS